jgi:hypothetical protein
MKTCLGLAITLALSSCARIEVRQGEHPSERVMKVSSTTVAFGLIRIHRPEVLESLCPGNWASVSTYKDPIQSLLTLATVSLYSPTTIEMRCRVPAKPKAS